MHVLFKCPLINCIVFAFDINPTLGERGRYTYPSYHCPDILKKNVLSEKYLNCNFYPFYTIQTSIKFGVHLMSARQITSPFAIHQGQILSPSAQNFSKYWVPYLEKKVFLQNSFLSKSSRHQRSIIISFITF